MLSELTVIVKNEEKRQTTKQLVYEPYSICENDPIIQEAISQAVKEFNAEPDDIRVKISMEIT
ncbi:MAG TPA: hypothetical protein VNX68_16505 [Nitrosopumilaceae archaeon]|jgi:hypothetical protein|nr:hypothetical protein [Nitrosopumilaceae archaeon]